MIRTPLRPLIRTLRGRSKKEKSGEVELEKNRSGSKVKRSKTRRRAEHRLILLGTAFFIAFITVGVRMNDLAQSMPAEPRTGAAGAKILAQRADIVDRKGRILATNFDTHSLYAQPHQMIEPEKVVDSLMEVFPDLDKKRLLKDFTGTRKFVWIKRTISPEQMQAVHDIGDPGLLFGPREMRLYPNGHLASHVLGGAGFGREGVHAAEVIGVAGIEKYLDERLRDPAQNHEPLTLSLDLPVQAALERVLAGGMLVMNAKGAAAILMDVHTGEIISIASLPDFNPNNRPRQLIQGNAADSPLFNRAVQGVYELGSTFKIFAITQAMQMGLVTPETIIDTSGPMRVGGFRIGEFNGKNYGKISVSDIIVESSNRGTARIALQIGAERQKSFLQTLGFTSPVDLEMIEASGGQPLLPKKWTDLSTVTISYGHGLSSTPLHLAAGYSAIANGGRYIKPTLLKQDVAPKGIRVMSESVAREARKMLRLVVAEGTASMGEVPGYRVGGKTGTADKPKENGRGYYNDKVISTFASMFPADDPKYVLIVTLDEPVETSGKKPQRTAGWTAVPIASEIITRVAPLLGLRPEIEIAPLP